MGEFGFRRGNVIKMYMRYIDGMFYKDKNERYMKKLDELSKEIDNMGEFKVGDEVFLKGYESRIMYVVKFIDDFNIMVMDLNGNNIILSPFSLMKTGRNVKLEVPEFLKEDNKMDIGAKEVWDLLKKFIDMDEKERRKVFSCVTCKRILSSFSASEFVEIMRNYEKRCREQDNIKPGDEVMYKDKNIKFVCISVSTSSGVICGFDKHGYWYIKFPDELVKTGKHYDVQSILDGLGGAKDETD